MMGPWQSGKCTINLANQLLIFETFVCSMPLKAVHVRGKENET